MFSCGGGGPRFCAVSKLLVMSPVRIPFTSPGSSFCHLAGAAQEWELEKPARPFDMASGTVPDAGNVTLLQMLPLTSLHKVRVIGSGPAAVWLGGAFWGMVLMDAAPGTGRVFPDLSPAGF